ncbi:polysaccharide export protein [Roseomonas sp. NAR14]|uniref:Polysaccharide export protein n=1 Tax=Roseomonas acroporae TaxID=2937791 RepID=A0A9X1Y318_9PROT|nr:polysaccharide biosynthesis/export family protein [Roseomonas acroporae]MCK8783244.1 polysaccharide export protein [Roseomonas acroporae]
MALKKHLDLPALLPEARQVDLMPGAAARRRLLQGALGFAATLTPGCAAFLPSSGVGRRSVFNNASIRVEQPQGQRQISYALIPLNREVVRLLSSYDTPPRFSAVMPDAPQAAGTIGIGDSLLITIFESARGGLFLSPTGGSMGQGNSVALPVQQVDRSGNVSVPFIAGTVRAAGRTPVEIQRDIESRLANRALEPQVVVTIADKRADPVSVVGDVVTSTRFSLDPSGERLLTALARAGGQKGAAYETIVTLQRRGQTERALLSEIAADPTQNIPLRPGDTIFIATTPRYFSVLGANGQSASLSQLTRRFPFDATRMTMAEAVAKAGGLQDDRADPTAVFLFRMESRTTLANMGIQPPADAEERVPTIYAVDYTLADGFFLSNAFPIREQDIIFISVAPAVEFNKFLELVLPFTTSGNNIRGIVNP